MSENLGMLAMNVLNTVMYGVIFVACWAYLNRVHPMRVTQLLAFGLTAAGAAGSALDLWTSLPNTEGIWHVMFRAGVACIAVLHFGLDRRRPEAKPAECPTGPHLFERRTTKVL